MRKLKKILKIFTKVEKTPIIKTIGKEDLLKGKVAFITGGSGGIGSIIATKFIECGCKIIISGTNEEKLEQISKKLGPNCKYLKLELDDISNIKSGIDKAISIYGKIDIYVGAHGIHTTRKISDFLDFNEKDYDDIMNINLKSTYFISQQISKYFIKNKIKGHILLISSSTALEPSWSPYRISKCGIENLIKGYAQNLIQYGIVVNGIAPGPTATALLNYSEGKSVYTDDNAIYRYTMPEEIGEYAVLLASDLGNTIVGDTIYMSGGRGIIELR